MILKFRLKALQSLYEGRSAKGLPAEFVPKIGRVLLALDNASGLQDLDQPGFGTHPLTGNMKGKYSIVISRNWRIVFAFEGQDVTDVDFIDYH